MTIEETLRDLVRRYGPEFLDDPDELRSVLDDLLTDEQAGEANLIADAVRYGAVDRLRSLINHGADPQTAVEGAGAVLAEGRGGTDPRSAQWACAAVGAASGLIPTSIVQSLDPSQPAAPLGRPQSQQFGPVDLTRSPGPGRSFPSPPPPQTPPTDMPPPTSPPWTAGAPGPRGQSQARPNTWSGPPSVSPVTGPTPGGWAGGPGGGSGPSRKTKTGGRGPLVAIIGVLVALIVVGGGIAAAVVLTGEEGQIEGRGGENTPGGSETPTTPEDTPTEEVEQVPLAEASVYGQNDQADIWYDACEAGDYVACDDLWSNSPVGSELETYAESCGGESGGPYRGNCGVQFLEPTIGSDPELDALAQRCLEADYAACDELWIGSAPDSGYDTLAEHCGNNAVLFDGLEYPGNCAADFLTDHPDATPTAAPDGGIPPPPGG